MKYKDLTDIDSKIEALKNPNCSAEIINNFMMDEDNPWDSEKANLALDLIASHPNTPSDLLENFFNNLSPSDHQKSLILKNPNCPEILKPKINTNDSQDKNLEGLLKELKSNKEIEFERLEKEFNNDDVIIKMENRDKSFVEKWYVAMAGQKFAVHIWKTGEEWKYIIEDFPSVAKALAQNENTNKDTILYILLFAKDLEKDKNTKLLAYEIQDLAFANPIFPDLRYELMADGADFYESAAGSLDLLPAMLKNPNYPSEGLLMVLNKIESIDNKIENIIRTVVKHKNFLKKHLVKD